MAIIRKYFEVEGQLIVGNFSVDETGDIVTSGGYNSDTFNFNNNVFTIDGESGDTTITGLLSTAGQATLNSLEVTNNSLIKGNLTVTGDVAVNGGDLTTNKTTFNLLTDTVTTLNIGHHAQNIVIGKDGDHLTTIRQNVEVKRNLTVDGQLEVAEGKFQFDGTFGDQGATRLQGILEVGQDASLEAGLTVSGPTLLESQIVTTGDLTVGLQQLTPTVAILAKFTVNHSNGNTVIYGTQNTKGAVDLDSTLNVDGNTTLGGTLGVTGNTTVGGTLGVTGNVTLSGNVEVTNITASGIESSSTLTKLKSTNVEISDTIVYLGTANTGNAKDIGFIGHFNNGTYQHTGLLRDATDGVWKLFSNAVSEIADVLTIEGIAYDPLWIGALTSSSTLTDSKGELRAVPQNTQGSSYTLVASDHGKHILASSTVTVPGNVFSAGQNVVVINWTGGNITLSQGTNMTMYQVATSNTGNRTMAQRSLVTLFFIDANNCIVSGSGLS
jgi:cytoskeletal protein CcmA (bactofilin family)